jgi:hypothetical protein
MLDGIAQMAVTDATKEFLSKHSGLFAAEVAGRESGSADVKVPSPDKIVLRLARQETHEMSTERVILLADLRP